MIRVLCIYVLEMDILLNDQLFVIGYLQGGYVSMVLYQLFELELFEEIDFIVVVYFLGFYSISGVMCDVMVSEEFYNFLVYLFNIYLLYNYVYGIYEDLEQIFKLVYVVVIENFYEGNIGLGIFNSFFIFNFMVEYGVFIVCYML